MTRVDPAGFLKVSALGIEEQRVRVTIFDWNTVSGLRPEQNDKFQQWASIVAKQNGILRVHLDLLYFPFP